MKIQVDWFKESGKWYAGERVEISNYLIWEPEFKQAIVDNQRQLVDSWVDRSFTVVCRSTEEQDNDPEFNGFYHVLFGPETFAGMKKRLVDLDGLEPSASAVSRRRSNQLS